jgi:LmbE family N-acetylglucosaminyl deacetylase
MSTPLSSSAAPSPVSLAHARAHFADLSEVQLRQLGPVLIVAPHPEDESLGVGGLIARLRALGVAVHVLVMTDGAATRRSETYPAAELARLREAELCIALTRLGCDPVTDYHALYMPDGALPDRAGLPGFAHVVRATTACLKRVRPATIVLPWRRDPHPDHRAAWRITTAAIADAKWAGRRFEYLISAWNEATPAELPHDGEMHGWRVDVKACLPCKEAAIRAHVSQTTTSLTPDATLTALDPARYEAFLHPYEVLLEDARPA